MKPFDLQAALNGAPICTRGGLPVRLICHNKKCSGGLYTLVGLITCGTDEIVETFQRDGRCHEKGEAEHDLMLAGVTKEGWINIFNGNNRFAEYARICQTQVFPTREMALNKTKETTKKCIATVKINWEE